MREIRFRAWDKLLNVMIDSAYGDWISFDGVPYTEGPGFMRVQKAKNYVLMQWTGLKDKHGKDIYEGDLLRYPGDPKNFTAYEVFFHDGNANSDYNIGFSISRTHFQGNIAGGHIPSFKPKTTAQMEVIGNIYQNSDLL